MGPKYKNRKNFHQFLITIILLTSTISIVYFSSNFLKNNLTNDNSKNLLQAIISPTINSTKSFKFSLDTLQEEFFQLRYSFGDLIRNFSVEHLDVTNSVENCVTFSPNGTIVATGSERNIAFWDIKTGNRRKFLTQPSEVEDVLFSPDGTILASVGLDKIYLWDMYQQPNHIIKTIQVSQDIKTIAFSPSESVLAVGGEFLELWNITTGMKIHSLVQTPNIEEDVLSVDFSPNGKILVSGHREDSSDPNDNDNLKFWNTTSGECFHAIEFAHKHNINSVNYSPNSSIVVTGGDDGKVKIWDGLNGDFLGGYSDHTEEVTSVVFSTNNELISSGSKSGTIIIWNGTNRRIIKTLESKGSVNSLVFSSCGSMMISGCMKENATEVSIWNMVQGVELDPLGSYPTHTGEIKSLAYSNDGTKIVSCGADSSIFLQYINSGELLNLRGHNKTVYSVAFSPDDSLIVSGGADNIVNLYNISSGERNPIVSFSGHTDVVKSVDFSPMGDRVVSGGADSTLKIWNITSGLLLNTLIGHSDEIETVKFSPNGDLIASSGQDTTINIWNTTNGTKLKTIETSNDTQKTINSISFSPNGEILASGSNGVNEQIKFWNVTTKDQIGLSMTNHTHRVTSIAFSYDGKYLVSGSYDDTIKLWNVTSQSVIYSLPKQSGNILSVVFSPDGKDLIFCQEGSLAIKLCTINPFPTDFDGDGMQDDWEEEYSFDRNKYSDKFADPDEDGLINILEFMANTNPRYPDTDNDSMNDGWEYLMGINPLKHDANDDPDNDKIPNFYEHHHQLYPLVNDAQEDRDKDGMPNLWEFRFDFSASDPTDALLDSDGDWVNNLGEYRGGSNPHDFWSIPLISLSIFHIALLILSMILASFITIILLIKQRKNFVHSLDAPDYVTAKKIEKSGLSSYSAYLKAVAEAKNKIIVADTMFQEGEFSKATQNYEFALKDFEWLQNELLAAQSIFKLCYIHLTLEKLTPDSDYLQKFPKDHEDSSIRKFDLMIKALLAESNKDWKTSEEYWKEALNRVSSESPYYTFCRSALLESKVKFWLNNPSGPIDSILILQVEEWQKECRIKNHLDNLCSLLYLRAKISLASFLFDDVENWLLECEKVAEESGLKRYLILVKRERERFSQYRQNIASIILAEKILTPDRQFELARDYLKKATSITTMKTEAEK